MNPKIHELVLSTVLKSVYADAKIEEWEKRFVQRVFKDYPIEKDAFLALQKSCRQNPYSLKSSQTLPQLLQEELIRELEEEITAQEIRDILKTVLAHLEECCTGIRLTKSGDLSIQAGAVTLTRKGDMDPECRKLLDEISRKNWELELEDFRNHYVNSLVEEELAGEIGRKQEEGMKPGAIRGAVAGVAIGLLMGPSSVMVWPVLGVFGVSAYMILSMGPAGVAAAISSLLLIPLAFSLLEGIGGSFLAWSLWLVCALGGGLCGAGIGAGLGMRFAREKLAGKGSALRYQIEDRYRNFILEPRDLLRFWELRLETFLKERQGRVQARMDEAHANRLELMKLVDDIREVGQKEDFAQVSRLLAKMREMDALIQDAEVVQSVLGKLENRFAMKIRELHALVESQRESELRWEKRRALGSRMAKVLEKTDQTSLEWMQERERLDAQLHGMVESFQEQLAHTRDFVQAEIELLDS